MSTPRNTKRTTSDDGWFTYMIMAMVNTIFMLGNS